MRQDKRAVIAQAQVELRCAVADIGVKGDTQLWLLYTCKGQAVIADEHLGHSRIKRLEPLNFASYLTEALNWQLTVKQFFRCFGRGDNPALIDDAVVLLFKLDEHLAVIVLHAVAADTKLFLIHRFFYRRTNEPPIVGVIIYVADRIPAVVIGLHVIAHTV